MKTTVPPIAEKVKFWVEQDKINQALIPRIIEMNESLKGLTTQILSVDGKIASSEARSTTACSARYTQFKNEQEGILASIEGIINQSTISTNDALDKLTTQLTSLDTKIEAYEEKTYSAFRESNETFRIERNALLKSIDKITKQLSALQSEHEQHLIDLKEELEVKLQSVAFPMKFKIAILSCLTLSIASFLISIIV